MKKLLLLLACVYGMPTHAMRTKPSQGSSTYKYIQKLLIDLPIPGPSIQELQAKIIPSQLTSKQHEELIRSARTLYKSQKKSYEDHRGYPKIEAAYSATLELITNIVQVFNVLSRYEDIEKLIQSPKHATFEPQIKLDELTTAQYIKLFELTQKKCIEMDEARAEHTEVLEEKLKNFYDNRDDNDYLNFYLKERQILANRLAYYHKQINSLDKIERLFLE